MSRQRQPRYVLARDIFIPAGTQLHEAPARIERSDKDGRPAMATGNPAHFVEAIVGPTKDTTYSWVMHITEALETGLIREADSAELAERFKSEAA
jgi:hypothetical protein